MIKINKGNVQIEGTDPEICADITIIIQEIIKNELLDERLLKKAIERGYMTKEQIDKEFKESIEKLLDKMLGGLKSDI